jgi:hypothetical protein
VDGCVSVDSKGDGCPGGWTRAKLCQWRGELQWWIVAGSMGHECETVRDAGFSGKENGELIALAEKNLKS